MDKIERDDHPSFALMGVSRVHATPGVSLFDSDIRHNEFVEVTLRHAKRERHLHRDWIFASDRGTPVATVRMSMAQWGAFVSCFNHGEGVPVTLATSERDGDIPTPEFAPRLAKSMADVEDAADKAVEELRSQVQRVKEAVDAGGKKVLRDALNGLEGAVRNLPGNMRFAAESLTEHAENVVAKAQADIEGMVTMAAARHGIDAPDLPELTA